MTRREVFQLLGAVPLVSLRSMDRRAPTAFAVHWDWNQREGGPVEYFEVTVTRDDALTQAIDVAVIKQVASDLRSCEVSVPGDSLDRYRAQVRAVNARGSAHSAPILVTV